MFTMCGLCWHYMPPAAGRVGEMACLLAYCGGLTLAECRVPTKASLSLPSSAGLGRENVTEACGLR